MKKNYRESVTYTARRMRKTLLLCMLLVASIWHLAAENYEAFTGTPVRLLTLSRESYQGTLYSVLEDRVEIVLADGQIVQILRTEIAEISAIDPDAGKRGLFQDAAANRLMVMPTAFPMELGEFHVADQEIVVVDASYGLTENVSLWAGISIPGLILSGRFSFYIAPEVGMTIGTFAGVEWVGGSALLLPYSLVSIGEPNRNLTFGGAAVLSLNATDNATPLDGAVAAFGGKIVVTPTTALISENWLIWTFDNGIPYPSINVFGISFRIAGNRLSWDIGAVVPVLVNDNDNDGTYSIGGVLGDTVIPLPLISLTYRID